MGALDKVGFAWKDDGTKRSVKPNDKLWHRQRQKLVEFKQKNGHCMV
jgi:hypothetical protein